LDLICEGPLWSFWMWHSLFGTPYLLTIFPPFSNWKSTQVTYLIPFLKECFISGLNEAIRAHVMMKHPKTWLEYCERDIEAKMLINAQTKRHLFINHTILLWKLSPNPSTPIQWEPISYVKKRWKNHNTSNFFIIVMSDISKGTNENNINYFKWMYPDKNTYKTYQLKTLLK